MQVILYRRGVERYEAAEHDIYLAELSADGIRGLPSAIPAVTSIHEPSQARLERVAQDVVGQVIADDTIEPPPDGAPAVAVLDTGVAEDHPLLALTLVAPWVSVVPGVTSAQDGYPQGHGTGKPYRESGGRSRSNACARDSAPVVPVERAAASDSADFLVLRGGPARL